MVAGSGSAGGDGAGLGGRGGLGFDGIGICSSVQRSDTG
jgi:hypothetical protein